MVAEFFPRDQITGQPHRGRETKLPAEKINQPALFRLLLQDAHLGAVQGGRFFTEDMFTGVESCERGGKM